VFDRIATSLFGLQAGIFLLPACNSRSLPMPVTVSLLCTAFASMTTFASSQITLRPHSSNASRSRASVKESVRPIIIDVAELRPYKCIVIMQGNVARCFRPGSYLCFSKLAGSFFQIQKARAMDHAKQWASQRQFCRWRQLAGNCDLG